MSVQAFVVVVTLAGEQVKARDTAKHPVVHRIVPTTKNCLIQNKNSAQVEKPCVALSEVQGNTWQLVFTTLKLPFSVLDTFCTHIGHI